MNYTRNQARTQLTRRGYSPDQVTSALAEAEAAGRHELLRHRLSVDPAGNFTISPRPWPEGETRKPPLSDELTARARAGTLDPAVPPDRGQGYYQDGGVPEILHAIEAVDAHLDANTAQAYRDQPLAGHMSRIGKAQSEAREAMEALAGVTGENPRKGVCDTWEHVLEELGDTACAALLGIQHVTKDAGITWAVFLAALGKAMSRVPGASPFPPEPGTDEQAARDNGITG